MQFVIDSVFALAHAVQDMLSVHCKNGFPRCPYLRRLSGEDFLGFIRNVSFTGIQSVGSGVSFLMFHLLLLSCGVLCLELSTLPRPNLVVLDVDTILYLSNNKRYNCPEYEMISLSVCLVSGISGDAVQFNANGDGLGRYDIYQFQQMPDKSFDYTLVGEWTDR